MSTKITPSLESITVRAKYIVPETDFSVVQKKVIEELQFPPWALQAKIGESMTLIRLGDKVVSFIIKTAENKKLVQSFMRDLLLGKREKEIWNLYEKDTSQFRPGFPIYFSIITIEHCDNGILVEVECRPAMWSKISQFGLVNFTENQVKEGLLECRSFVKQVMSMFKGKEVEPVSVYPIIQRTEIKSRLLNLGLKEVVSPLDKAERHIVQNNFTESLKSSRTAFEKMIDWEMKKRGLELTSNQRNNLDRLRSKGYLDKETTELLQSYYKCLSNIAVHERGEVEPGLYEANMGYGITLIMLDYLANKLP